MLINARAVRPTSSLPYRRIHSRLYLEHLGSRPLRGNAELSWIPARAPLLSSLPLAHSPHPPASTRAPADDVDTLNLLSRGWYTSRMLRARLAKAASQYFQKKARLKLERVGDGSLYNELTRYHAQTKSTGCQWSDYWTLYAAIRKYHPREVLECGTGASTLVIAHALQENGAGRVTSMEEGAEWFAMAQRLLPSRYSSVVDLRVSDTIIDGHAMFRGIRYRDVPHRLYDFVFIDGPNQAKGLGQAESCDFDFIDILRRSTTPVRAIVDSRTGTFWTIARILGHDKVRFSYLQRHGIILPCTTADLRTAKQIAHDDFRNHAYARPSWTEYRL